MSKIIQTLSAYFFNIEYFDDPNIEVLREEIDNRHNEASNFIIASKDLIERIRNLESTEGVDIQTVFYDIGKQYFGEEKTDLFRFFEMLYMTIWERKVGPRFGVFAELYGKNEFADLIDERLDYAMDWI